MLRIARFVVCLLLCLVVVSVLLVMAGRWLNPPVTALMLERHLEAWMQGQEFQVQYQPKPWVELSDHLKRAVLAAEDQKFFHHRGFDLDAIQAAWSHNERGGTLRGASTLSQQLAKNLFLWSGRSWVRKGIEAWFTLLMESLWPKTRILELYLNCVEWGEGWFGAEVAAQRYFGVTAAALSPEQSSLLAAILPNPRVWSASRPSAHVIRRADWIRQQVRQLGGSQYLEQL